MSSDADSELDLYIQAVLGKKAENVVVLDVAELTSIADVFIICSGKSNRQVNAIAEHIQISLKKHKIKPLSVEGNKEGHWVLLDYGHVIIHVFYQAMRDFYDLDGLWVDAGRIMTPALKELQSKQKAREESTDLEPSNT
jgi:ribosome-associated protein